jgi:hypothetical protein
MKKLILVLILILLTFPVIAPVYKSFVISKPVPVEPYKKLIYAVGMVEGKGDTATYNELEMAAGYFQIRPVRVEDYNNRTGSHYTLDDMFSYEISEKVFLYFATQIGPYDLEKIARNWNGRGVRTIEYWKKIKKFL